MSSSVRRICRASFSYPTTLGPGSGLPAYYVSQHMSVDTLLLARHQPGQPRSIGRHVRLRLFRVPNPVLSSGDGRLWRRPWRAGIKLLGMLLFAVRGAPYLVAFRPQVVHIHTPLPLALAAVGKLMRAKVVVTVHGTDFATLRRSRMLRIAVRILADRIFFVSRSMNQSLAALFPDKRLVYTPSGVDPTLFANTQAERRRQLICVANLRWQKGYPALLEAFRDVSERLPDYSLVVVGDGDLRDELIARVGKMNLVGKVQFTGRIPQEDVARLLNESELYVSSSVSEGFPKSMLEALACGLPVVATGVGSCGEVVRDNEVGLVVPPGEPSEFADAVVRMLTDRGLYQRCASRSEAASRAYSWQAVADQLYEEYDALLQSR